MKLVVLIVLMMASVSGVSAEENHNLQGMAESFYNGRTEVEFKKRSLERAETYNFEQPIDRVIVNRVDDPLRLFGFWSECSGLKLMAVSCAVREIYLYAGEESLNCYVRFESEPGKEIKLKGLVECN